MDNIRKDSFPSTHTTSTKVEGIEYVLLRMPSVKSFPETIDWTVKPPVGYYMFQVVGDELAIMWGETSVSDPQVVAKRAEIEAARTAKGLGHRHTAQE